MCARADRLRLVALPLRAVPAAPAPAPLPLCYRRGWRNHPHPGRLYTSFPNQFAPALLRALVSEPTPGRLAVQRARRRGASMFFGTGSVACISVNGGRRPGLASPPGRHRNTRGTFLGWSQVRAHLGVGPGCRLTWAVTVKGGHQRGRLVRRAARTRRHRRQVGRWRRPSRRVHQG